MTTLGYGAPRFDAIAAVVPSGYTPPDGLTLDIDMERVGFAYAAPNFDGIVVTLLDGYVPPDGTALDITLQPPGGASQTIFTAGLDALLFGLPLFGRVQTIVAYHATPTHDTIKTVLTTTGYTPPSGIALRGLVWSPNPPLIDSNVWGTARIDLKNRRIGAVGFDSPRFGQQEVRNNAVIVGPAGVGDATIFGLSWASFLTRQVTGVTLGETLLTGQPEMSGGVRNALMNGFGTDSYGVPTVTFQLREVLPQWWVDTTFGTPVMGYARAITLPGINDGLFGDVEVFDNTIRPDMQGYDALRMGDAAVGLYTRYLGAKPVADLDINNIGFPKVYNLRQIITATYRSTEWIEGGVADSLLTNVRNVNRVVDLIGNGIAPLFRGVSEGASLDNRARVLHLDGFDATQWGVKSQTDGTFIAYRNRNVGPQGWEPNELSSRFHNVRNFADQIFPVGSDMSAIGVPPLVVNTRRTFYVGGLGVQTAWGVPFIAPGVRTLLPAQFQQSQEIMGGATMWYRVRSIAPTPPAFPNTAFGIAALDIHFNIVASKSIPSAVQFGMPKLVNNTPEVKPYWDSDAFTLFGRLNVFNKKNPYSIEGSDLMQWGLVLVEYRTKTIIPTGFDALRPNLLHKIQKLTPDPPENRYVTPGGRDMVELGVPNMTNNGLSVDGIGSMIFGNTVVDNRGIFVVGIHPPYDANGTEFGTPFIPFTIWTAPEGLKGDGYGKPRLSPYTIYAPRGATDQAQLNNGGSEDFIDGDLNNHSGVMPLWGTTRVELKNRIIFHNNFGPEDGLGIPSIGRNPQYITPKGTSFTKYGYPELFGGDRSVLAVGYDMSAIGTHLIAWVPERNRKLLVASLYDGGIGTPWVSNFIRDLPIDGLDATIFGGTIVQRPPPPAEPNGLDATEWGNPMVAYRIRHVYPEGFDSFVSDYSLGNFRDRMRVKGRIVPMDVTMGVQLTMGMPLIETGLRGITAPSVGDTRDQLGMPVIHRQNRVSMVSAGRFDAWGDAWVMGVEHGLVAPRGDDASAFGQPRMRGQIRLDGWIGAMGVHRLAKHAGAEGIIHGEFGAAVLLGFGCGKQARVMHGFDSAVFGTAQVSRGT